MQDVKDKVPKMTNREKLLELFGKDVFRNMMTAEWWGEEYKAPKEDNE